jgi:hypothetical protein
MEATLNDMIAWPSAIAIIGTQDSRISEWQRRVGHGGFSSGWRRIRPGCDTNKSAPLGQLRDQLP